MNSTNTDHTRMMTLLESESLDIDPDISEISEESPPVEAGLIVKLEILLEQMRCLGYGGACGVEDQLCAVCDEILSGLPTDTLLDAVPWYSAPMQMCKCAHANVHNAGLAKVHLKPMQRGGQSYNFVTLSKISKRKHNKWVLNAENLKSSVPPMERGTNLNCVHHHHVIESCCL